MTPDRYRVKVDRLAEVADQVRKLHVDEMPEEAHSLLSAVETIALELGSFIAEATFVEGKPVLGPSAAVDTAAIESRFVVHELALAELYSRLPVDEPTPGEVVTVFGFPVRLSDGITPDDVQQAVDSFGPLDAEAVVKRLEANGLLVRVGPRIVDATSKAKT